MSCPAIKKYYQAFKKVKIQFEEKNQASEPDSDMAGMVELSDKEFKKL